MALAPTSKSQITALLAVLADPFVQTQMRDAATRLGQPNVLPLLGAGHGAHLTSSGKSTVTTAIATLATDVASN